MSETPQHIKALDAALVADVGPKVRKAMQRIVTAHMDYLRDHPDDDHARLIAAHLTDIAGHFYALAIQVLDVMGSDPAENRRVCDEVFKAAVAARPVLVAPETLQ